MDPVFLKTQEYIVLENNFFQDNRSSIILEKNGKDLIRKYTKRINSRYLFITDRVAQGDVSLIWYPTRYMIRDFMTKPLQGALLCKFRDQIMRVIPEQDLGPGKAHP